MSVRVDKRGRNVGPDKFTKIFLSVVQTDAWRALSTKSHSVYLLLKLEWKGPKANNNGKIRLSVRQASYGCGISINTAAKALHELQAKGLIFVTRPGCLGIAGEARSPTYELTELPMPTGDKTLPRNLFRKWKEGHDFEIVKHPINNPRGIGGKTRSRHRIETFPSQEP